MSRNKLGWLLAAACIAAAVGCAHYPVNPKLARHDPAAGYRFDKLGAPDNSDELFVILTFSGGGTRAAALAYGVLEQLRATTVQVGGQPRSLLEEVDVISSISGGSFAAAYYALFRDETFTSFKSDVLDRPIERDLKWRIFACPWNWVRLASPWFDRGDVAAEYYQKHIFRNKTFADLIGQARRPYLILNATDMTLASDFEFTQEQFDLLGSDLAGMPIGRAVAASSCFPVAFTPINVKNYPKPENFRKPEWIANALADPDVPRRLRKGLEMNSYLDAAKRPYIHLIDGGVADNLGVRAVLHALTTLDSSWSVPRLINLGKVKGVAVIVVNARVDSTPDWDRSACSPSIFNVLETTLYGVMNNYTFETFAALKDFSDAITQAQEGRRATERLLKERGAKDTSVPGGPMHSAERYVVDVSFDRLPPADRDRMMQVPTRLALPKETTLDLRRVGAKLLRESPDFRRLVSEFHGAVTPAVQE